MRRALPLFPLELVLYPDEVIPLHIFEPRYKAMVRDCLAGDQLFGVVLVNEGHMSEVGCIAEIREILRTYPDGRMDISVVGKSRFRVRKVIDDKEYMLCDADPLVDSSEQIDADTLQRVITQHMKLLEVAGHKVRPTIYQGVDRISYLIARNAGLNLIQKQQVLERQSENERIQYLVTFLEAFIPRVQEMEQLRTKIRSNGHFPDFSLDDDESDQNEE